ncbi:hypothetical protein [Roseimaritima sediminicola]|uniref:hypothetical protein n=1 Tax=Roseimaritima sediminicola TaxID=2662066 RepID=UPI001F32F610|nr:hypothetical protein [Roseimaritima sediminicola]
MLRHHLPLILFAALAIPATARGQGSEADYYRVISVAVAETATESRSKTWQPAPDGLPLEVSGIAVLDDRRVAVAIRKGEIWILDGVYDDPPAEVTYHRFATALHEPLGLLWHEGSLYTAQRSELTRITDTDGDGTADRYDTVAKGWGVTGHYHEYAYGPKLDGQGRLWVTLNIGLGLKGEQLDHTVQHPELGYRQGLWRGWGLRIDDAGDLVPVCAGMRSPSGLGANAAGDMFYTDQQGNWVGAGTLHHMRERAFFHHADALASAEQPGSPLKDVAAVPNGLPFPEALSRFPQLVPPAVWFPYKKMGQSATDIMLDASEGRFGPFAGQLFVGEFTLAGINRVFLEQVDGQYQGACFPFRSPLASAVLRLAQGTDGSVFVGLTNRGWSSLGRASYGLQRLVWTGKTPFEILEMQARPDGFELVFTRPVDPATAADPASYALRSFTYQYHSAYGSDEIDARPLAIQSAVVSPDGRRVRLRIEGLRELYVHELVAAGVRDGQGHPLLHTDAYYTLNRIPAVDP